MLRQSVANAKIIALLLTTLPGAKCATLRAMDCQRVYKENLRSNRDRPGLARLLDLLRDKDVVLVTHLDRLARSTRDLISVAEQIKETNPSLRSAEPWADTTSQAGALIHQSTNTGRVAARQRSVQFGRTPKLGLEQLALARRLADDGRSPRRVTGVPRCHRATLYRALNVSALESGPDASNASWLTL